MSKNEIKIYYEELAQSIMDLYDVDNKIAYEAIRLSDMDKIIQKIGDFVYHDVIEHWAKSVWNCYNRKVLA